MLTQQPVVTMSPRPWHGEHKGRRWQSTSAPLPRARPGLDVGLMGVRRILVEVEGSDAAPGALSWTARLAVATAEVVVATA
jgi:hypothetical protein